MATVEPTWNRSKSLRQSLMWTKGTWWNYTCPSSRNNQLGEMEVQLDVALMTSIVVSTRMKRESIPRSSVGPARTWQSLPSSTG
jgi:hypothetical protein